MAAGMPGVGIGGLFYLGAAIALPLRSAWRRVRGVPDTVTTRQMLFHLGIAGGIIAGIWLAGWLLALALPGGITFRGTAGTAPGGPLMTRSVVRMAAIAAGFITLGGVMLVVEIGRLTLARKPPVRSEAPLP